MDGYSPHPAGALHQVSGDHVGWSDTDFKRVVGILRDAISLLGEVSRGQLTLVQNFTRVIVVRCDPRLACFRSASTPIVHGRPVLHNPHFGGVCPEDAADALLHEAVHALLDLVELDSPMTQMRTGPVVRSPWTGASLSVSTYVQACWIWFAVAHLWRRASASIGTPASRRLRARAEKGFEASLLEPLGRHVRCLSPGVAEALERMRAEIEYG